jgi:hypothetical protein
MGWFDSPKVPSTISDKKMKELQRRAEKTWRGKSWFSPAEVDRRKAASNQKSKSWWS